MLNKVAHNLLAFAHVPQPVAKIWPSCTPSTPLSSTRQSWPCQLCRYLQQLLMSTCWRRGSEERLHISSRDVGRLEGLLVQLQGSLASWQLSYIRVTHVPSGEATFFPCDTWLDSGSLAGSLAEQAEVLLRPGRYHMVKVLLQGVCAAMHGRCIHDTSEETVVSCFCQRCMAAQTSCQSTAVLLSVCPPSHNILEIHLPRPIPAKGFCTPSCTLQR